jgi:hypothetical protein
MKTKATLILLAGGSAMLAACGSGGGILGRDRPDEFAVQRQAPLVVPPDFSLTPPAPGTPRPAEGTAAEQRWRHCSAARPRAARSKRARSTALERPSPASAPRSATRPPRPSPRVRSPATSSPRPKATASSRKLLSLRDNSLVPVFRTGIRPREILAHAT